MMSDIQPTPESEKQVNYRRDEFSNMTDREVYWYDKGYETAKSRGWSDSQKEAIRRQLQKLASHYFVRGTDWGEGKRVSASETLLDEVLAELEAITKGEQ